MRRILNLMMLLIVTASFTACQKWKQEHTDIYSYTPPAANPVSDKEPLSCSGGSTVVPVKGTMLSGKNIYGFGWLRSGHQCRGYLVNATGSKIEYGNWQ
ncbi:hypothetical protein [Pedobacter sp. NJ-S-72]